MLIIHFDDAVGASRLGLSLLVSIPLSLTHHDKTLIIVNSEGQRALFRVALAIFKMNEQAILAVDDSLEVFQVIQVRPTL